jgi:hypothetical protein
LERGWIRLWRKIQDDPLWRERREFSKAEAWIDILMEVRHEESPVEVLIKNEVFICHQGESLYSLDTWARRWRWSRSKVRRFFELLKKMRKIDTVPCSKSTHLKVLKYNDYNKKRNADETQMKRRRNASETQTATNKNDNNYKNDKNIKTYCTDSTEYELAKMLGELILERKPDYIYVLTEQKNDWQKWTDSIRLMIERDNRKPDTIREVIKWCQRDKFWQDNICSTVKLRKQFDRLELKMRKEIKESPNKYTQPNPEYLKYDEGTVVI